MVKKLHGKDTLDVPHEIIEDIIVRLPVKSLIKFRAVSKKWEATISDPEFSRTHLQHSKRSACQYIFTVTAAKAPLPEYAAKKFNLIERKNQEFQVKSLLKSPGELTNAYFMCHLDGMLLLQCDNSNQKTRDDLFALWNPSTTKFIMFNCPYQLYYIPFFDKNPVFFGLCYDALMEDYKVVLGIHNCYTVFNCRNKHWTEMKECPINDGIYAVDISEGVYFNESLYWVFDVFLTHNDRYLDYEIVCYNPMDDKFKQVSQPKDVQNGNYPLRLALLGGHLCVYCYHEFHLKMSVLKLDVDRDSWTEFITVDITPLMYSPYPCSLFMIDENEIVMRIRGRVVAYNLSKKTLTEIKGASNATRFITFPFVESLVLGFDSNTAQAFQTKEISIR